MLILETGNEPFFLQIDLRNSMVNDRHWHRRINRVVRMNPSIQEAEKIFGESDREKSVEKTMTKQYLRLVYILLPSTKYYQVTVLFNLGFAKVFHENVMNSTILNI